MDQQALVSRSAFGRRISIIIASLLIVASITFGAVQKLSLTAFADDSCPINCTDFVTTWKVEAGDTSITVPTYGTGYSYNVDWDNDGIPDQTGLTGNTSHDFDAPGEYTIRISGDFPRINFNDYTLDQINRDKLISIDQWGDIKWNNMKNAFIDARNLVLNATDAPDLHQVTDLSYMFSGASSINSGLNEWDVSGVTNMKAMFRSASNFNGDISNWDTSSVTDMSYMFQSADDFNQDISNWDTSSVTDMSVMFNFASNFNSNLSEWDVSSVTDMHNMFQFSNSFNQDISNWNVSNVTDMNNMFALAPDFNGNISNWNTSSVTDMSSMLQGTSAFNHDLSGWNISNVTDMSNMLAWSGISQANYDSTLIGWSDQAVKSNVQLGSEKLQYCSPEATAARNKLINEHNWEIAGDLHCSERPVVSAVDFDTSDNSLVMTVSGQNLFNPSLDEEGLFMQAFMVIAGFDDANIVELNGSPLPVCAQGIESVVPDIESVPGASLTPPCYYLAKAGIDESSGELDIKQMHLSQTQALIWLPSDYDTSTPGSLRIGDSDPFLFNQAGADPDDGQPKAPSVAVNGNKPIGQKPTIPKRPTFTGTAEPGSLIRVVIQSGPNECTDTANSTGTWACTPNQDLVPGEHTVTVFVTPADGGETKTLGPYTVIVSHPDGFNNNQGPAGSAPSSKTGTLITAPNTSFAESTTNKWVVTIPAVLMVAPIIALVRHYRATRR